MKKTLFTLFILHFSLFTLLAVPAKPGLLQIEQEDGTFIEGYLHGDESFHYVTNTKDELLKLNESGKYVKAETTVSAMYESVARKSAPRKMNQQTQINLAPRGLVILVNFSDKSFTYTHENMEDMLNGASYTFQGATGSAKKYFTDQSNSLYIPQFDVVGPVTLPQNMAYYGANNSAGNDKRPEEMIRDACVLVDSEVDFTQYDNDNDGEIDFVYVFYAGYGEASGAPTSTIWPHAFWVYDGGGITCRLDGKLLNAYACSNELSGKRGTTLDGIGTFCHEFSHVLGLPDYYDTEYGSNYNNNKTPEEWHIMDGGSYNNDGKTPPNYSAHDKYYLGWVTPTRLTEPANVTLPCDGQTYYAITSGFLSATSSSTVYYLENRQKTGWDAYLPGHGMMITKVMYSSYAWEQNNPNNSTPTRYEVIRAAGYQNGTSPKDLFPGTARKTSYTPITGYDLTEITETNSVITFKFMGGVEAPPMTLYTVTFNAGNGTCDVTSLTETAEGIGIILPEATPHARCAEDGWRFAGWSSTSIELTRTRPTLFEADATYRPLTDTTLYAVYSKRGAIVEYSSNPIPPAEQYMILFDAGNGSCDITNITVEEGYMFGLPTATPEPNCAREGWTFAGWATESIAQTSTMPYLYLAGESYMPEGDVIFYAVYQNTTEGVTYYASNPVAISSDLLSVVLENNTQEAEIFDILGRKGVHGTGFYILRSGSEVRKVFIAQ